MCTQYTLCIIKYLQCIYSVHPPFSLIHNVFTPGSPEHSVWLLDLSLSWHHLSNTFTDYLRLAVVHLGLKQWPYALTSNGLSPLYEVSWKSVHELF